MKNLIFVVGLCCCVGLLIQCSETELVPEKSLKIKSLNRIKAQVGQDIEIYGENFSLNPNENIVKFGDQIAPIISADRSRIVSRVPFGVARGKIKLYVQVGPQIDSVDFEVAALQIKSFSPWNGPMGSVVDIIGDGFPRDVNQIRVYFYNKKAEILAATDSTLRVKVPTDLEEGNIKISVYLTDEWIHSKENFLVDGLDQHWEQLAYLPVGDFRFLFQVDQKAYFDDFQFQTLWIYDLLTDQWEKKGPHLPQILINNGFYHSDGLFYFTSRDDIWTYSPSTQEWKKKIPFLPPFLIPEESRENILISSTNGRIYMGLGFIYEDNYSRTPQHDLWEFNPFVGPEGQWTQLPDHPNSFTNYQPGFLLASHSRLFLIAYADGDDNEPWGYKMWEYDAQNPSQPWPKKDFISDLGQYGDLYGFTIHGEMYVQTTDYDNQVNSSFKYDVDLDDWISVPKLDHLVSFSIQKDVYSLERNFYPSEIDTKAFWRYKMD